MSGGTARSPGASLFFKESTMEAIHLHRIFTREELEGFVGLVMAQEIYNQIDDSHIEKIKELSGIEVDKQYLSYLLEHHIDKGYTSPMLGDMALASH